MRVEVVPDRDNLTYGYAASNPHPMMCEVAGQGVTNFAVSLISNVWGRSGSVESVGGSINR